MVKGRNAIAMTPKLEGPFLTYDFEGEDTLVNISSAASSDHPWNIIQFDRETVTSIQGGRISGGMEMLK